MNEMIDIAQKVILESRNGFTLAFPYLSYPLTKLGDGFLPNISLVGTDGVNVYVNAQNFLKRYVDGEDLIILFMHTLLHNLFRHPFKKNVPDSYNLACDICVFCATDEMGLKWGSNRDIASRKLIYKSIIDTFGGFNMYFCTQHVESLDEESKNRLIKLFFVCDHSLWIGQKNQKQEGRVPNFSQDEKNEDLDKEWREMAKNVQKAMQNLSNPTLKKLLAVSGESAYDYREFLKKFIKKREKKAFNDQEFDYNFYCYGLSLYKNLPLIENLEYDEKRTLSDIVIAIDTSGSTQGEPVKRFLEESCSIIFQADVGKKLNVRIIECDAQITADFVVKNKTHLDQIMQNFEIKGGGGTDFRPVFDKLSEEQKSGKKIRGLIYFTDGMGVFPQNEPNFKVCFALYGHTSSLVKLPHFAYRIQID